MNNKEELKWNHHCFSCRMFFDAKGLNSDCPQCKENTEREALSLVPELEKYDIQYPSDWKKILKLHNLTTYTERELNEMYEEMLDECSPEVCIGTLKYSPSYVLKNVDPVAFEIGFGEYVSMDFIEHPFLSSLYLRSDEYEDAYSEECA